MSYPRKLVLIDEEDLFQYSSSIRTQQSNLSLDYTPLEGLSYLYRENSMNYISQFLNLFEVKQQPTPSNLQRDEPSIVNACHFEDPRRSQPEAHEKPSKKIQKNGNSPFHNYQKHLNNALKKIISLPMSNASDPVHKQVAQQIWNIYLQNDVKTKKIIHTVFSHRNPHLISQDELKCYGFWQLYCSHGQKVFNEAKGYLSQVAIDQIEESSIENYLMTRKLVKKQGFKEYVLGFKKELKSGSLKRRSISEAIEN